MKLYAKCIYSYDDDEDVFTKEKIYEVIEFSLRGCTNLVNDIYRIRVKDNYGYIYYYPLNGAIWGFEIVGGR